MENAEKGWAMKGPPQSRALRMLVSWGDKQDKGGKPLVDMTRREMRERYKWGMKVDFSYEDHIEQNIKWALSLTPREWERWKLMYRVGLEGEN